MGLSLRGFTSLVLRGFTSLVLSRRMTIVVARDLLRKPKKTESQGQKGPTNHAITFVFQYSNY